MNKWLYKRRKVSGEITVFLSLIFILLISFILAMTESAAVQTAKNQRRLDVDRAIFSLFGEYQVELLENYEIFAVDGTYQTGQYDERQLLGRLSYYGSAGISQEITDLQLLTDNHAQAFREQVLEFMEMRSGISLVENLTGFAAGWEETEIQGKEMSRQLDEALSGGEQLLPEEAGGLVQAKAGGILALALPRGFSLSPKSIHLGEQSSQRSLNTGRGSFPARTGAGGIEEKLLFEQYILDYFRSAAGQEDSGEGAVRQNRSLEYELEYILCGKASDEENLKAVVNRLLPFRFAMNYQFLMSNLQKQEEAALTATAISILLLHPEAEEVIKNLLLVLWGFGESVMDLRALLAGKRTAMRKDEESWQLQLSSLFQLGGEEDTQEGRDSDHGLTYRQYLQILLFLGNDNELTMRTLDRVEQNLMREQGLSYFRADACVTKMKVQSQAEIWNGCTYTFPVYFGYL